MKVWAIVPAAGVGRRAGGAVPKQYQQLAGATVLEQTLLRLFACSDISHIYVPLHPEDKIGTSLLSGWQERVTILSGGAERADSVFNALTAFKTKADEDDWVLVHDAARPCLRPEDIEQLLKTIKNHPVGGLLGVPVADTLKLADADQRVQRTLSRDNLWRAYTPQIFRFGKLYQAMENALKKGLLITDEASALEVEGHAPLLVQGHSDNIKITHPQDFELANLFIRNLDSDKKMVKE